VKENSTAVSFGLGANGALGHGSDESNVLTPKAIAELVGVRACSAGYSFAFSAYKSRTWFYDKYNKIDAYAPSTQSYSVSGNRNGNACS
jgi:hypothetical protein